MKHIKTDKKIHPLVAWPLIIGLSIGVLLGVFIQTNIISRVSKEVVEQIISGQVGGEAVAVLDYGNGNVRKFKGPVEKDARALNLLQEVAVIGMIDFELIDHFAVKRINGFTNGEGDKQWNIYVNDAWQKRGPFEISVKPGDEVVFKFE